MKELSRLHKQKGFTLVELAIVLVIIGLLIGGILKGQQLIDNARVTAQMTQFQGLQAAETSFQDAYSGLPGDVPSVATRVPNMAAATCDGNGDGIVGVTPGDTTTPPANLYTSATGTENICFFTELTEAGYLSGVSNPYGALNSTATTTIVFGGNVPQSKLGSGLLVSNVTAAGTNWSGLYTFDTMSTADPSTTLGQNSMTPGQAAQIDRKMDDGNPTTGSVLGIGNTANCMTNATGYVEASTSNDCDVGFKLN